MVEEVYKVVINGETKYVSTKEEAERLEKEAKENEKIKTDPTFENMTQREEYYKALMEKEV